MNTKKLSALEKLARRRAPVVEVEAQTVSIPLDKIRFNPDQPRQDFHQADGQVPETAKLSIEELAASIEKHGQIQHIVVETVGDGTYRVVVGERRTRAFLLLGRTTIRAVIDDTLDSPKKRRIFQLAENVNRADLTDADMASNIRALMDDSDGAEPMTQTEIAKALGKSGGWVSRYVKFGDEELQRLWMNTGIADTVEKLYRLSILPMHVQAEIQRRVQLPEDDPEHLAKPLLRSVIDELASEAKEIKKAQATNSAATPTTSTNGSGESQRISPTIEQQSGAAASATESTGDEFSMDPMDPVTRAFAEMAEQGQFREPAQAKQKTPAERPPSSDSTYKLPESAREKILGQAGVTLGTPTQKARAPAQPPVSVRAPMASLQALLRKLDPDDQATLAGMELSINLPGPLAERIANTLTGMVVDRSEVPAVVQTELVKLQ